MAFNEQPDLMGPAMAMMKLYGDQQDRMVRLQQIQLYGQAQQAEQRQQLMKANLDAMQILPIGSQGHARAMTGFLSMSGFSPSQVEGALNDIATSHQSIMNARQLFESNPTPQSYGIYHRILGDSFQTGVITAEQSAQANAEAEEILTAAADKSVATQGKKSPLYGFASPTVKAGISGMEQESARNASMMAQHLSTQRGMTRADIIDTASTWAVRDVSAWYGTGSYKAAGGTGLAGDIAALDPTKMGEAAKKDPVLAARLQQSTANYIRSLTANHPVLQQSDKDYFLSMANDMERSASITVAKSKKLEESLNVVGERMPGAEGMGEQALGKLGRAPGDIQAEVLGPGGARTAGKITGAVPPTQPTQAQSAQVTTEVVPNITARWQEMTVSDALKRQRQAETGAMMTTAQRVLMGGGAEQFMDIQNKRAEAEALASALESAGMRQTGMGGPTAEQLKQPIRVVENPGEVALGYLDVRDRLKARGLDADAVVPKTDHTIAFVEFTKALESAGFTTRTENGVKVPADPRVYRAVRAIMADPEGHLKRLMGEP